MATDGRPARDAGQPAADPAARQVGRLGPHVVGQRVVVRRVLPGETGPSGGPALTDVLGVCESWADGVMTVRRADGSLVSVATADIVSGKPVPPRPSVRLRVSPRDAESHALVLWPDVEHEAVGEWVLRSDPAPRDRLVKRANSCLAVGDPGLPLSDALARVHAFYAARDRPVLAQVERDADVEAALRAAGWSVVPGGDADLQVAALAQVRRRLGRVPAADVEVEVDEDGRRSVATLRLDGQVVAVGRAGLDDDWLGVHGLHVDPAYRRRGLGTAVMAALLERGAEEGATTLWLHVETDNLAARALYDGLGLVTHHGNRYLAAPGSAPP